MAVIIGTNAGFCAASPTLDPSTTTINTIDNNGWVNRDTSPSAATKINEIGWWCDNATEEANFEVGLYAADGAVVPGEAGTLLYVSRTNAKGTTAGWKKVTGLDWDINPNTIYWIAVQLDNTATTTNTNATNTGFGNGYDNVTGMTTLADPFGGGTLTSATRSNAIYAVWSASTVPLQLNIGDSWKEVNSAKINIGDSWKNISGMQINIGDSWKEVI